MTDTPRIFPKGGRPQGLLGFSQVEPDLQPMIASIFSRYPALAKHQQDFAVFRGRPGPIPGPSRQVPQRIGDDRQLESYPTDESWNPIPGKATTELFNSAVSPAEQQQLITGDMLHHLARIDPQWDAMKRDVLPPELRDNPDLYGSVGDEFLMGYITPDAQDSWRDVYSPEQRVKLEAMRRYLLGLK